MLDTLLCFDKNRVFAGGNSSGAWLANELGCKYAGDALRPIRGILPNTGDLPSEPQFKPTCTNKGMAGIWVRETGDNTAAFTSNGIFAMNRAMEVNGCPPGQTYDTATYEDFPIPGLAANTCRRITGCDPLYPIVTCPINGISHRDHAQVVNPAAAAFLQAFSQPPLTAE
jgi:poly(3-hydroxybutyrate) depolymerase